MLVLGSKSREGHVLRLIVGPETDLYLDVHGAGTLDLTPVLFAMNGATKVMLSLTRCKSETSTSRCMQATAVPHLNSFEETAEPEQPGRAARETPDPEAILPAVVTGRCSFCGKPDIELLRVPGVKVCPVCAQIELNRLRISQDTEATKETP